MKEPASRRLAAIASLVPPGKRVADVGSGHGILARTLLDEGRARGCIATERDPAQLARLAERLGPAGRRGLELRHGDGLQALAPGDRVEVVVLAGLGARAILGILDRAPAGLGLERLVLQPQSESARLRRGLADRGHALVDEVAIDAAGRLYEVLAAEPRSAGRESLGTHPLLDEGDLLAVGPWLVRRPGAALLTHWKRRVLRLERCGGTANAERARDELTSARRILAALLVARSGSLMGPDPKPAMATLL